MYLYTEYEIKDDIYIYKYSVFGPSSLVGILSPRFRGDQSERGPKTLCEFNNQIIIYLYKIVNLHVCWIIDN